MAWSGRSKIEVVNQKVEDLKQEDNKKNNEFTFLGETGHDVIFRTAIIMWLEQPLFGFGQKSFRIKIFDYFKIIFPLIRKNFAYIEKSFLPSNSPFESSKIIYPKIRKLTSILLNNKNVVTRATNPANIEIRNNVG